METAVVKQFLNFFHDFLEICQLKDWPNNDTSNNELKNAFIMSQHVVKCLDKLQQRSTISDFLSTLNSDSSISNVLLKTCLHDPPKYILKKLINSSCKTSQLDEGFKIFIEMFSETKLEECLSDFFLESASKTTLLKHMSTEFNKDMILKFKSILFLSEINNCNDCKPLIREMLSKSDEDIELLLLCMLNKDIEFAVVINIIVETFTEAMASKDIKYRSIYRHLYMLPENSLINLCNEHNKIFKLLAKALLDCGRLLKENMSAEYFYIDLTYSELKTIVRKICKNEDIKIEFLELVMQNESERTFWNNILQ
ncbi:uncharacterized protein Ufm1 isoform X1 [Battus philenor]|uniref:uncharacterized protein Ufm1 isoform X1 n=1 Tax=Battus philenor TaxID=42288 RepID=UPI0035D0E52A